MINLFILVLIHQYEEYNSNPDNPMYSFEVYLEKFKKIWSNFATDSSESNINRKNLINFFLHLKQPMGFFILFYFLYFKLRI